MPNFTRFDHWFQHLQRECQQRTLVDWNFAFENVDAEFYFSRGETTKELIDWIIAERDLDDCKRFPHVDPDAERRWSNTETMFHKLQLKALADKRPAHAKGRYCDHADFAADPVDLQSRDLLATLQLKLNKHLEAIARLAVTSGEIPSESLQRQVDKHLEKLNRAVHSAVRAECKKQARKLAKTAK